MTFEEATEILRGAIRTDGSLLGNAYGLDNLSWERGDESLIFEGRFTLRLLEAIVVYCTQYEGGSLPSGDERLNEAGDY